MLEQEAIKILQKVEQLAPQAYAVIIKQILIWAVMDFVLAVLSGLAANYLWKMIVVLRKVDSFDTEPKLAAAWFGFSTMLLLMISFAFAGFNEIANPPYYVIRMLRGGF